MKKLYPFVLFFVLLFSFTIASPAFAQACDPADPTCIVEEAPTPTDFVLQCFRLVNLVSSVEVLRNLKDVEPSQFSVSGR